MALIRKRPGPGERGSRASIDLGGIGSAIGAASGGTPEMTPEASAAQDALTQMEDAGAPNPQGLLTAKESKALTTPFKSEGFFKQLTRTDYGNQLNRDILQQKFVGDVKRQQAIDQATQIHAQNLQATVNAMQDEQALAKYGVKFNQLPPDVQNDIANKASRAAVDKTIAEAKLAAGTATRQEDIASSTHDVNKARAITQANTGLGTDIGALNRVPDVNIAENARVRGEPLRIAQELGRGSVVPLPNNAAILGRGGDLEYLFHNPSDKEEERALFEHKVVAPNVSPFPSRPGATISTPGGTKLTIPAIPQSTPLEDITSDKPLTNFNPPSIAPVQPTPQIAPQFSRGAGSALAPRTTLAPATTPSLLDRILSRITPKYGVGNFNAPTTAPLTPLQPQDQLGIPANQPELTDEQLRAIQRLNTGLRY